MYPTTQDAVRAVQGAFAALPSPADMSTLLSDSRAAEGRGYYDPVEDERLRETYARYLAIRASLWDVVQGLRPAAARFQAAPDTSVPADRRDFAIALCAAEIIVRTGEVLIDLARDRAIVWQKLDEADLRYRLPRKSFTRLYRQLTSAFLMHGFYRAVADYDVHRDAVMAAAPKTIRAILSDLNLPTASRGDHLRRYRGFVRHSLKRRNLSAWKKILFSLFEMTGSDIADLKIPLIKPPRAPKRVTQAIRDDLRTRLRPGDVFITRHDDAMSNLFLPGFWPHAALWLGAEDADILEAKKDGVLLRRLDETLQVDAFVVLRPNLPKEQIDAALARARSHAGKPYDFVFDFRTSDRLVCTEVIYRAYHGMGDIRFDLVQQAGRHCLPAEDLLNQGLSHGWFDVLTLYGVGGNLSLDGEAAKTRLRRSFASVF